MNASTLSWITDYKILGGNLGFAATIPFPIGAGYSSNHGKSRLAWEYVVGPGGLEPPTSRLWAARRYP